MAGRLPLHVECLSTRWLQGWKDAWWREVLMSFATVGDLFVFVISSSVSFLEIKCLCVGGSAGVC